MKKRIKQISGLLLLTAGAVFLFACEDTTKVDPAASERRVDGRWYSVDQVNQGEVVFEAHCQTCHGEKAQGLHPEWRKTLPDGSYPPPPLNGTAHAWHHPLPQLMRTIDNGGIPLGGVMPAFKDVLIEEEKLAAVAFFQSQWKDNIYQIWEQR